MINKMYVRKLIDRSKAEYSNNYDTSILVHISILKGLYIALGGTKCVTIPAKFDKMVTYSKVVFEHKLKLNTMKCKDKVINILIKSIRNIGCGPEYYLSDELPLTNEAIARLLVKLVISEYTEDMIINSQSLYNITISLLNDIDSKEGR